jgi:NADH-quinone oxidoreductase subunit L
MKEHIGLYLLIALAPLFGAIVVGLFGRILGERLSHWICILGVAVSFAVSVMVYPDVANGQVFDGPVYTWLDLGTTKLSIGFLIDKLTILMMMVVSFVSLMVHIYTIGYMEGDPGYTRFFSYISLFTFSMLMLVMANNFVQLFFGWEAVGLVSYLLIGFWYTRPTAIYANLKAFLVNRVGDFGFVLGIGLVLATFGTLDYAPVFQQAPQHAKDLAPIPGVEWGLMAAICILLFIGAMGKSAQVPLHVWLPDSMEGPTPISALIHAATMVTAGIFMVARMSPLFELSDTALSFVIVIGAITAFFTGLLAIVQNDIKRVVAYSTLSQLGYMTVALGASAYSVAIFHLMTHAFFKALLFLAAGSVIIAMHHDQDIRNMGGLRKYMPITWITSLIGSLALIGTPFFSGFYSKDTIIEATALAHVPGARLAYWAVLSGVFITAFYSFRMYFMVFHGEERFRKVEHHHAEPVPDVHGNHDPHETPWVVTVPLILLAIPSVVIGYMTVGPILAGNWFGSSIVVSPEHEGMAEIAKEFHSAMAMALHAASSPVLYLVVAGVVLAWFFYIKRPDLPEVISNRVKGLYTLLVNKYYFDTFNDWFFAGGARLVGNALSFFGDRTLIDGVMVNGSARFVGAVASVIRYFQSGYIYQYAFTMIIGVFALLTWLLLR